MKTRLGKLVAAHVLEHYAAKAEAHIPTPTLDKILDPLTPVIEAHIPSWTMEEENAAHAANDWLDREKWCACWQSDSNECAMASFTWAKSIGLPHFLQGYGA